MRELNKSEDLRAVYHCPEDGRCKIVIPAPGALKNKSIDEIIKKAIPENADYRIVHKDKLPSDRIFRDAWTDKKDTDTVDVDLAGARKIQLDRNRKARNKELSELDIETMKHIGNPDKLKEVEKKKQALRDMPVKLKRKLEKAKSADEIANIKYK